MAGTMAGPESGKKVEDGISVFEGDYSPGKARFTLVVSRFNSSVVDGLVAGAVDALKHHGVSGGNIKMIKVPGAFELPLVAGKVAEKGDCDAIIALGAVIRGATPHFDYVAGACANGLGRVSMDHAMPVAFGVLTTDNIEQAIERSGGDVHKSDVHKSNVYKSKVRNKTGNNGDDHISNKGADAALTALEMVNLLHALE